MDSSRLGRRVLQAQVVAVIGCVLRDEDQLAHASRHQLARFGDDGFRRTADGSAFDAGNGTERARAAAAIRDLDVGRCALDCHTSHSALVCAARDAADGRLIGQMIHRRGCAAASDLLDELDNVHPPSRADDAVQPRHLCCQLLSPDLRKAPGGDEKLAALFGSGQLAQTGDGFLARRADKAAGVDDEDRRFAGILYGDIARAIQQLRHAVRIYGVLGTA